MADNPRIEELRRRVQTDPASIAFAQLAEEYRRGGNVEDAVRVCRAGLERHPSYLSARVTLGRALIELQQYDDARTELEYVLRSAPENLAAIRGLAEIHQRRGNLSEALRQYQTALGIARHDPELEESVHDLSRQLGAQPAPVPVFQPLPAPSEWQQTQSAESPEPPPAEGAEGASDLGTQASLSPELEAAADEFTKALQALDALGINLPETEAVAPPPSPEIEEPQLSDTLTPAEALAGPEALPIGPDAQIVDELETWLDAIVLERAERRTP